MAAPNSPNPASATPASPSTHLSTPPTRPSSPARAMSGEGGASGSRWGSDGPSSSSESGVAERTYCEVLRSGSPKETRGGRGHVSPAEVSSRQEGLQGVRQIASLVVRSQETQEADGGGKWYTAGRKKKRRRSPTVPLPSMFLREGLPPALAGLCFKCLEPAHVVGMCTGKIRCLRCKQEGHVAKECKQPRDLPGVPFVRMPIQSRLTAPEADAQAPAVVPARVCAQAQGASGSGYRQVASGGGKWYTAGRKKMRRRSPTVPLPSMFLREGLPPALAGLCFKCLEPAHVVGVCTGKIRCLRCKQEGHVAKECKQPRGLPGMPFVRMPIQSRLTAPEADAQAPAVVPARVCAQTQGASGSGHRQHPGPHDSGRDRSRSRQGREGYGRPQAANVEDSQLDMMPTRSAVEVEAWVDPMLCEVEASRKSGRISGSLGGCTRGSPSTQIEESGRKEMSGLPAADLDPSSMTGQSWPTSAELQGSDEVLSHRSGVDESRANNLEVFCDELSSGSSRTTASASPGTPCTLFAPTVGFANPGQAEERLHEDSPGLVRSLQDEETLGQFRARIRKPTVHILSRPNLKKTRTKRKAPTVVRRSCRIAGVFSTGSAIKRQQRALITRLKIAREGEIIGDEALQAYLTLFDEPLGDDKIAAIVSLFGWEPEELHQQEMGLVEIAV